MAPRSEVQPAFFHGYEYVRGQKLGVIKLNPQVSERLAKDGVRETLHPRHLPMLIKPKPWLSHDQGGYLYNRSKKIPFPSLTLLPDDLLLQHMPCGTRTVRNK